jgi:hypothetical protein
VGRSLGGGVYPSRAGFGIQAGVYTTVIGAQIFPSSSERPALRILFFLLASNFDRSFACFLEALVDRGHAVEVLIEKRKRGGLLPTGAGEALRDLERRYSSFSYAQLPAQRDPWLAARTRIRLAIDFLRYLEPEYRDAEPLRARARDRAPLLIRLVERLLAHRHGLRIRLTSLLRSLDAAMPISSGRRACLADRHADVVLVSPLVGLGSAQSDWVRLAAELGIPSVLPVASWDNLTNKGVLKEIPRQTLVWNEAQAREAVELQGVPADRVVVTGAHSFDHWFGWEASTEPDEFAAQVGLPRGPYLLFACSSRFIAEDETDFVREWVERLRAAADPRLRELGVLVRPHPQNARHWTRFESAGLDGVAVWPRAGASPTHAVSRRIYFDSIFHSSGVVGINTSVFIESAIIRRPTFTLVSDAFRPTQDGTLHFAHLTGENDEGPLIVARSWDEHLEQLGETLRRPGMHDTRIERFLESFVRPHGLDVPAAPLAADAVEAAALLGADAAARDSTPRLARKGFTAAGRTGRPPARTLADRAARRADRFRGVLRKPG